MFDPDPGCEPDEDGVEIDARDVAPLLGLTPERLMAELRAGEVYHSAEECSRDDGRVRVTFRYRARTARVIIESDGSMHPEAGLNH